MKKRRVLALVLVLAMLCVLCAACANEGTGAASGSESSLYEQSVSVAETGTDANAESSSRADGTSGGTSTESASSDTSTESETSGTTSADGTSANSTSSETSTGTESSATSSDTSTSSKPAENSENSKPTEGSENSGSVDTSSGSGNTNPSQTGHKHSYKTTVVKPTCTEDGYTLHTCSCGDSYTDNEVPATGHEFGPYSPIRAIKKSTYTEPGIHERVCMHCEEWVLDEKFDEYWEPPVNDEEEVYRRIIALKEEYPDGSVWDAYSKYEFPWDYTYHRGYGSDYACNGFAAMVSNTAFGTYWGEIKTLEKGTFTIEDVRVGDLIYENDLMTGHVMVALEVHDDYIITVDGNNCGTVCWGDENGLLSAIFSDYLESNCIVETRYDPECF